MPFLGVILYIDFIMHTGLLYASYYIITVINRYMNSITKKLIRDYIYHSETLEDVVQISTEAEQNFRDALNTEDPKALEALASPEGSPKPKKEEDESVKFDDSKFKKLFRKLAVRCHPDKLETLDVSDREKSFLKECYEMISIANDTYDWGLLLKVALDLDVEVNELEQEQIDNINQNIEAIKARIEKYEASMAYKWYTLTDSDIKQKYLQQCADIFKKSLNMGRI
jgi:hypothetical protein